MYNRLDRDGCELVLCFLFGLFFGRGISHSGMGVSVGSDTVVFHNGLSLFLILGMDVAEDKKCSLINGRLKMDHFMIWL